MNLLGAIVKVDLRNEDEPAKDDKDAKGDAKQVKETNAEKARKARG